MNRGEPDRQPDTEPGVIKPTLFRLRLGLEPSFELVEGLPLKVLVEGTHGQLLSFSEQEWHWLLELPSPEPSPPPLLEATRALSSPSTPPSHPPPRPPNQASGASLHKRASQDRLLKRALRAGLLEHYDSRLGWLPPRATGPSTLSGLHWRPLKPDEVAHSPQSLPEARYTCYRCGESCAAGYVVGALPQPALVESQFQSPVPTLSGLSFHLHHHNGCCVLRDQAGSCTLHAQHGLASKPRACQDFPLLLLQTPAGLRLALMWECTRLHVSLRSGPPLSTQLPPRLDGLTAGVAGEAHSLDGSQWVPFARYLELEGWLLDRLETGDPDRLLLQLPRLILTLRHRRVDIQALDALVGSSQNPAVLKRLGDELQLALAGLILRLKREGDRLKRRQSLLHPQDKRLIYGDFVFRVVLEWCSGRGLSLQPLPSPSLWRAWLRNRIFGLGLLRAPDLFAGAIDLLLRYLIAREGLGLPLDFAGEGSPGDEENRRIVAVEHVLREERLSPLLTREQASLRRLQRWLET